MAYTYCGSDNGVICECMNEIRKTLLMSLSLAALVWAGLSSAVAQRATPADYIEQNKEVAVSYMEKHGCPASIILAIAMHESAYGTSRVASYLNNHFGIKGPNNSKEIKSAYKGYDSVAESYADFIDLLKRRKSTRRLFEQYEPHEYEKWVKGIARSGYAHSPSWSSKVIAIIRKYNLNELDIQPEQGEVAGVADEPEAIKEEIKTYTVKRGDTLYDLARKYGTTVKALLRNNGLKHSRLQIGQQLIL